jgi:hypothetical protein
VRPARVDLPVTHRSPRACWEGPLARAGSIVDVLDGSGWKLLQRDATDSLRAEWREAMAFPSDSLQADCATTAWRPSCATSTTSD